MPKVKIPRKSTNVDMTAMCDVAFLLLSFFMLTTKFKPQEPVTVDMPSSRSEIQLRDRNVATITVAKDGRAFFGVDNQEVRARLLERMAAKYSFSYTEKQLQEFKLVDMFGVPVSELPTFLSTTGTDRIKYVQKGIPTDTTGGKMSELADWLYEARVADKELHEAGVIKAPEGQDPDKDYMIIAVRGDGTTSYPAMEGVINALLARKIYKFNLITNMERGE